MQITMTPRGLLSLEQAYVRTTRIVTEPGSWQGWAFGAWADDTGQVLATTSSQLTDTRAALLIAASCLANHRNGT